jgi:hypothetical protein
MLRGSSGFYSYAIYEHLKDWPDFDIGETRITFKLRKDKYSYYITFSFVCHIKLFVIYPLNYFKDIISTCKMKTLAFGLYEETV